MVSMNRLTTEKRAADHRLPGRGQLDPRHRPDDRRGQEHDHEAPGRSRRGLRRVPGRRPARPALQAIEGDEIWAFCYAKQKNVPEQFKGTPGYGDVWTWTAICADTKLVPSWLVGERDLDDATSSCATSPAGCADRIQLTTDGHRLYRTAGRDAFGARRRLGAAHQALRRRGRGRASAATARRSAPARSTRRQRRPRPGADLDQLRRAAEPDDADGHAPLHAADQRVLQEGREPRARRQPALHALQLRPAPPDAQMHAGEGGRRGRQSGRWRRSRRCWTDAEAARERVRGPPPGEGWREGSGPCIRPYQWTTCKLSARGDGTEVGAEREDLSDPRSSVGRRRLLAVTLAGHGRGEHPLPTGGHMARIDAYHTNSLEYPPSHRDVYHNDSNCPNGKASSPSTVCRARATVPAASTASSPEGHLPVGAARLAAAVDLPVAGAHGQAAHAERRPRGQGSPRPVPHRSGSTARQRRAPRRLGTTRRSRRRPRQARPRTARSQDQASQANPHVSHRSRVAPFVAARESRVKLTHDPHLGSGSV